MLGGDPIGRERWEGELLLAEFVERGMDGQTVEGDAADAREAEPLVIEPVGNPNEVDFLGRGRSIKSGDDTVDAIQECRVIVGF